MVKIKKEHIFLITILSIGFILRIWGIGFGLSYQFHQDEPIVVNHALAYGTGDLNPHFFAIPPLTSYILFFIYVLYFFIGKIFGIFQNPDDFALAFFKDPTMFYSLGRIFIGVIPGTLCIIFTYKLCKKFFHKENTALFTSALVAFNFLSISDSHYIYTDMLLSLFVVISMIRIMEMFNKPVLKNYIICAFCIGISISIKYNVALLLAPFLAAHIISFSKKRTSNIRLITSFSIIMLTLFVANPFAFLDFRFFLSALKDQSGASSYIGWLHHLKYSLYESVGIILLITGFFGLFTILLKEKEKAFIFLSFPMAFYLHLVFLSQPFARYVLVIIPFFAISAGYFIFEYLLPLIAGRSVRLFITCFFMLPFIFLFMKAIKLDILFTAQDTRIETAKWIKENIAPNAILAFDHTFFRPALTQSKEQILAKYPVIDRQKGLSDIKDKKVRLALKTQTEKGFYMYFLNNDFSSQGQFLATMPTLAFDFNALRQKNIDYIVINYANHLRNTEYFYANIAKEAKLIYSINPYRDSQIHFNMDPIATTCMPVASKELFRKIKNGPALEIYKLER